MIDLTDKQRKFCEEYVIDLNAKQAAIRAGYSESTAKQTGYENLTKPYLKAYVKELQEDLSKATGVTAIRNILELKKIAFTNIADFKKTWYTLEDFEKLPKETKAALSEITHTETTFGKDSETHTIKFKLHDKLKAIDMLNKMLGFNAPEEKKIAIEGKIGEELKNLSNDELANHRRDLEDRERALISRQGKAK